MMEKYPKFQSNITPTRTEGIQQLEHGDIISKHFCWTIVGVPGSGKTTFIQQLMNDQNFYKDKFDYVLQISPSPLNINGIDPECITSEFRVDWLYERINYIRQLNLSNKNILIILDDCISQIKQQQNNQMLIDLFFNRRHIIPNCTISIMITTQQYTMLPFKFRGITDHFTFLSMSPRDYDFIKKEIIYSFNKKCMEQVVDTFQIPHQFIYIRTQPFLLCQNFRPLILGSSYVAVSNEFDCVSKSKSCKSQQGCVQEHIPQAQQVVYPQQQQQQKNQYFFTFKK